MRRYAVGVLVPSFIVVVAACSSSDDDASLDPRCGTVSDPCGAADGSTTGQDARVDAPSIPGTDGGTDSAPPQDSGTDSGPDSGTKTCSQTVCSSDATCSDATGTPVCTCKPGFSGDGGACSAVDDCAGAPCLNGGTCVDGTSTYTCTCAAGYSGTNCQTNIDDCAGNPCLNAGTCVDGVNAYTCTCAPGYSGTTCQTNIDECTPNPCLNAGTCADGVNSFTCTCAPGYSGTTCQTNVDECTPNPCLNGGSCADGINAFTCTCANGYVGPTCASLPTSCKAMKLANPAAPSGLYAIDPDGAFGAAPFNVYCDMVTSGGGWTIVTSYSGAANEQMLTSDTETVGDALAFAGSNLNVAKKIVIAAGATESLLVRNNGAFMKLSKPIFDAQLATPGTHVHTDVVLTLSDGTVANGYMGYSNFSNAGGGDFGISTNPDGPTSGGFSSTLGFDHHNTVNYNHLNWSCTRHYLYRYGAGSGYNVNTAVGSWTATAACDNVAGGDLAFYAAMR